MGNPKEIEVEAEAAAAAEAAAEAAAFTAFTASTDGVPPPPYQETDCTPNTYPPSGPAPPCDVGESSLGAGSTSGVKWVKCKFPAALNAYFTMGFTKTFHLGEAKESPLFAARMHSGLTKNPELVLYDGPSEKGAIMATATHESMWRSNSIITVAAREGVDHDSESQQVIMSCPKMSLKHKTYRFTAHVGVGKESRREEFEWRSSHGSEVRELDGYRWGWKLVRLSSQSSQSSQSVGGGGGDRATRAAGSTSDGFEVVAAWAHNNSMSITKAFKFRLMGSALTGMLGDRGAALALISAMRIWAIELATASAAGAAAS